MIWTAVLVSGVLATLLQNYVNADTISQDVCVDDGQFHSDACLLDLWYEAGCKTVYPIGESQSVAQFAWWRSHPISVVKNDMHKYFLRSAISEYYCTRCMGDDSCAKFADPCVNSTVPHSNECLLSLWRKAGCPSDYPTREIPDGFWRNHEINVTLHDMEKYYNRSYISRDYCMKCFYDTDRCDEVDACAYSAQPHQNACLLQIWHDVGCVTSYPAGESVNGFWRNHDLGVVRNDMTKWYTRSYKSDSQYADKYAEACLGTVSA